MHYRTEDVEVRYIRWFVFPHGHFNRICATLNQQMAGLDQFKQNVQQTAGLSTNIRYIHLFISNICTSKARGTGRSPK